MADEGERGGRWGGERRSHQVFNPQGARVGHLRFVIIEREVRAEGERGEGRGKAREGKGEENELRVSAKWPDDK